MWLKPVIAVLLLGVILSLASSLFFLLKDEGKTHRTVNALTVRVTLSALLLAAVIYGIASGQLTVNQPFAAQPPLENVNKHE